MLKQNFNANWRVKTIVTDIVAETLGGGNNNKETIVTLPHDPMIFEPRLPHSNTGGACGFYPGKDYEYTKKFYIPEEDKGKAYVIEFEGIYNQGRVYVNDDFVGSVHYGYTSLILDISAYLKYGCENLIRVIATNSDVPNSRWYTGAGLYRPVNLYVGGPLRIDVKGLKISTPDVSEVVSMVKVQIKLKYDAMETKTVKVHTDLKDSEGKIAASEETLVTVFGNQNDFSIKQGIYVKNAKLWSVDEPHLYTCEVKILDGDVIVEEAAETFGIRKITIDNVHGMRLNGKTILLRGGCIHHDNGPVGAATFPRAEERRVEIMKQSGFNAVRSAHNSVSSAFLEACDKHGLLVMEESFDAWNHSKSQFDRALHFSTYWEKDVESIVEKDFNHPSVIMYSIGNEIQELGTPVGARWNRMIADKFRELDPTRLVTNGVNGLLPVQNELTQIVVDLGLINPNDFQKNVDDATAEGGDAGVNEFMTALGQVNLLASHPIVGKKLEETFSGLDISGYNYMRGLYDITAENFPNRIFYGSETLPTEIAQNWEKVKTIPTCVGDFGWTAWDYIGEAGVGIVTYDDETSFMKKYPAYLAYCGDIDIIGHRRPMSYYREIVYGIRKEPYIAVQLPEHYFDHSNCTIFSTPYAVSSWTWPGFEGKPCKVEVYSESEEIELKVNGKSIGRMGTGEKNLYKAIFDTVYYAGKIEAVAYTAGEEVGRYTLSTADSNIQLVAKSDRNEIDKEDLAYVLITLEDLDGRLNTSVDRKVKVTVDGAGKLQGFANADPRSTENFYDTSRTTFYGKALAVIRSENELGIIKVVIEAEGCEPVTVEISVK